MIIIASPQKENGYTPIANELLEQIYSASLNGTQVKIILFIARYTYGFSRKEHELSVTFISRGVGVNRKNVILEIRSLVEMKVVDIVQEYTAIKNRVLKINKDYEQWGCSRHHQVTQTPPGDAYTPSPGDAYTPSPGDASVTQDKQNIKQNLKQYIDEFKNIWKEYPNQKGKAKATDRYVTLRKKYTYEQLMLCVTRYVSETKGKEKTYIQYGSTFFNKTYIDYLDENYSGPPEPDPTEPEKPKKDYGW